MGDAYELFRAQYRASLEQYLEKRDETTLSTAYELGRRALVDGFGLLELASMHAEVTAALSAAAGPKASLRSAGESAFFRELLSPFEMALRGYRRANDELRSMNVELERQAERLALVNGELESFSYSVSHDLRAPLRSIDGFSQALLEDYGDVLDAEGKKFLGFVRDSAQHMAHLIDDLLSLAHVTRSPVHRKPVDMSAVARRIVERLRAAAPTRAVDVVVADSVVADGDERLVTIALENLLGNAWKFTSKQDDAKIEFGVRREGARAVYFVRDNGAGFDMTHAAKLFGAFQRLHSSKEFEGTGIGLATVQRVVHRHGGQVWAEGTPGKGASFYFTLEPREKS